LSSTGYHEAFKRQNCSLYSDKSHRPSYEYLDKLNPKTLRNLPRYGE
jgi:hypothetical protein